VLHQLDQVVALADLDEQALDFGFAVEHLEHFGHTGELQLPGLDVAVVRNDDFLAVPLEVLDELDDVFEVVGLGLGGVEGLDQVLVCVEVEDFLLDPQQVLGEPVAGVQTAALFDHGGDELLLEVERDVEVDAGRRLDGLLLFVQAADAHLLVQLELVEYVPAQWTGVEQLLVLALRRLDEALELLHPALSCVVETLLELLELKV